MKSWPGWAGATMPAGPVEEEFLELKNLLEQDLARRQR